MPASPNKLNIPAANIQLEFDGIDHDPLIERLVTEAILRAIAGEKKLVTALGLVISNDGKLQELNRDYVGYDQPTDVLAFDLADDDSGNVEGDIYISLDRAREQALERREEPSRETARLAVHGFLHLCGWDHDDDESLAAMVEHGEVYLDGD